MLTGLERDVSNKLLTNSGGGKFIFQNHENKWFTISERDIYKRDILRLKWLKSEFWEGFLSIFQNPKEVLMAKDIFRSDLQCHDEKETKNTLEAFINLFQFSQNFPIALLSEFPQTHAWNFYAIPIHIENRELGIVIDSAKNIRLSEKSGIKRAAFIILDSTGEGLLHNLVQQEPNHYQNKEFSLLSKQHASDPKNYGQRSEISNREAIENTISETKLLEDEFHAFLRDVSDLLTFYKTNFFIMINEIYVKLNEL